jgi:hypothetical protein
MRFHTFVFSLAFGAISFATEPYVLKPYTLDAALNSGSVEHDTKVPHLLPVDRKMPEYDYLLQYIVPRTGFPSARVIPW